MTIGRAFKLYADGLWISGKVGDVREISLLGGTGTEIRKGFVQGKFLKLTLKIFISDVVEVVNSCTNLPPLVRLLSLDVEHGVHHVFPDLIKFGSGH